jgi:hypothetical protein
VTARLHARAEDRERRRVRPGEELGRHRRHSGRPHLGDEPTVHRDERLAGLRTEKQDQRVVGGDAVVAGIERHQLGAERTGIGGHRGEEAALADHLDHLPTGLDRPPSGQVGECARHRRNEVLHPQAAPHRVLVQDHRYTITTPIRLKIAGRPSPGLGELG